MKVGFVRWQSCQYEARNDAPSGMGSGEGVSPPQPTRGSVVSSPSGVRSIALAANAFLVHYRVAGGFRWIEKCEYSHVMQKQKFLFSDTKTLRLRHTVKREIFALVFFSRIGYIAKFNTCTSGLFD